MCLIVGGERRNEMRIQLSLLLLLVAAVTVASQENEQTMFIESMDVEYTDGDDYSYASVVIRNAGDMRVFVEVHLQYGEETYTETGFVEANSSVLSEFDELSYLKPQCNLLGVTLWINSTSNTPPALFRVCKLSNGDVVVPERVPCADACLDDLYHCCAAHAQKSCQAECCRTEFEVVDTPQCCAIKRNATIVSNFVDLFDFADGLPTYTGSDGVDDWSGERWIEAPIFDTPPPANLDDNEPDEGRIQVLESNLRMQCGGHTCSLGCITGYPMYAHRHVSLHACSSSNQVEVELTMTYNYILPTNVSESSLATLKLFTANGTLLYSTTLAPSANSLDFTTLSDSIISPAGTIDHIVEISVPVLGCTRDNLLRLNVAAVTVKLICTELDVSCSADVDTCGVCNGNGACTNGM
jgi:hypothetical protein